MAPQVSVIIPVYNIEAYLARCLESVLAQTYEDFEVFLVDDGSGDSSAALCREYCSRDTRFTLIQKENGGLSSARNAGLDAARGTYVAFIDGDDSIHPRMLEVLHRSLEQTGSDIAVCDYYEVFGTRVEAYYGVEEHFVCDNQEAYGIFLLGKKTGASVCTKMFRLSSIGGLRFKEGIICEDAHFDSQLMGSIKSVSFELEPLYYYHHRQNSISTRGFDTRSMDTVRVYEQVYTMVHSEFPKLLSQALFRLEWAYFFVFDQLLLQEDYRAAPNFEELYGFLKSHSWDVVRNADFRKSRRIAALALRVGVSCYRFLLLRNNKRIWGQ
ncbi:MAG: glycosyltransferase [Coriobacteriales bacterium]|jgi:glycosyltransferase involved in cell wall biosynthesis|nr:glycosyltransferase [Coriobacteriales bacterium]